jgi:endoribonuclease Dicer
VGEYYGAKGIDEWSLKSWEKEIDEHDVSRNFSVD